MAVTVGGVARAGETGVQDGSSFDLLGVRHSPGEGLGVTSREAVVQVVFHCLFGNGEAHSDSLVVVTSGPCFLRIVIRDGLALVLHRSGTEASQFGFFLERTLRRLLFINLFMLFAVTSVLHTEQSVQAGEKFFK